MAKYGPDPKGDRTQFTARLPTAHLERYKSEAESCGLALTDYLALKLAEAHDLPEPEYIADERERRRKRDETAARRRQREELPISA
jgi:hypothetical protein